MRASWSVACVTCRYMGQLQSQSPMAQLWFNLKCITYSMFCK